MSLQDLQHAIARHVRDAIPGHEPEDYMRAARAASTLWRGDEYRAGYRHGKEVGLAESTMGGEVAKLRDRLRRYENAEPSRPSVPAPVAAAPLDFGDWEATA